MQIRSVSAQFWPSVGILTVLHSLLLTSPRGAFGAPVTKKPGAQLCDLSVGQLPGSAKLDKEAIEYIYESAGKLTPMWAQEAIGGPESMQFLNEFERTHPEHPLKWVPIGISDGMFNLKNLPAEKLNEELRRKSLVTNFSGGRLDNEDPEDTEQHSYTVTTLISDSNGFGTGYRSYLSWFSDTIGEKNTTTPFIKAQVKPWFINRSIGNRTDIIKDQNNEIIEASKEAIVVSSAGNAFPWSSAKGLYPAIIVGAITEIGTMADFSSHGKIVDVTAPGNAILAYKAKNQLALNSGTSFASPLVTGVLSSVASILPSVQIEELREMIRRTAIRTVAYLHPLTGDGVGVINQYGMLRAAARLAKDWPKNRKEILTEEIYDFESEIEQRKRA
ncbi:MAG: S8/S53 family peptidase, partial [Bdellovibrionales bacterium]|nr:S8/S53 family peptidase [Bdellovibrionales bacterium]